MSIVRDLNAIIAKHSGTNAQKVFYDGFMRSEHNQMLQLPLLISQAGGWEPVSKFDDIVYTDINGLKIENPSQTIFNLYLSPNFGEINSLEQAFKVFIQATSHSNALGDFRQHPQYYYPILQGMRYFSFHGDGNCVLLGLLLQSFIKHFLNEKINVFYSCGSKREFMHVYCRHHQSQQITYLDADQKIWCSDKEVNQIYSHGLIFQLLGKAGFHAFDSLSQSASSWFYPMTHTLLDEFRKSPNANIYERDPLKYNFSQLFAQARDHSEEQVFLDTDDYPWKKLYRNLSYEQAHQKVEFMNNWQPIKVELPKDSSLTIGMPSDQEYLEYPNALFEFPKVFFGRVMMRLKFTLSANLSTSIYLPELPWMILYKGNLSINGKQNFHIAGKKYSIIPMGQLEHLIDKASLPNHINLICSKETDIEIIFPINALALNNSLLKINTEKTFTGQIYISQDN